MTTSLDTTTWRYRFGDRLRSHTGEEGEVIARTEKVNLDGALYHTYRLEIVDQQWQQTTQKWFPEVRLTHA